MSKILVCRTGVGVIIDSINAKTKEIDIEKIFGHVTDCDECKKELNIFIENLELPTGVKLLINNFLPQKKE